MTTKEDLEIAFSMLDAYRGPEDARVHWLADQFTSYGDELDDEDWRRLEAKASKIIDAWRFAKMAEDALGKDAA